MLITGVTIIIVDSAKNYDLWTLKFMILKKWTKYHQIYNEYGHIWTKNGDVFLMITNGDTSHVANFYGLKEFQQSGKNWSQKHSAKPVTHVLNQIYFMYLYVLEIARISCNRFNRCWLKCKFKAYSGTNALNVSGSCNLRVCMYSTNAWESQDKRAARKLYTEL